MSDVAALRSAWQDVVELILDNGNQVFARQGLSDQEMAEGVRQTLRLGLLALTWRVDNVDPDFPIFQRMNDNRAGGSAANIDILYLRAQLHGDAQYAVYGEPGGRDFVVYACTGDFAVQGSGKYLGEMWSDEIEFGPEGNFEMAVGGSKNGKNWLPLEAGTPCWVAVRQYFRDWKDTDIPGFFAVRRTDGPTFPLPLTCTALAERFRDARGWLTRAGATWPNTISASVEDLLDGRVNVNEMTAPTGSRRIGYSRGYFQLEDDQALLIDVGQPLRRDWNFGIFNIWSDVGDFQNRQMSLNDSQAWIGADGVLRVVVSTRDLGHPNWLDTGGNCRGQVWYRVMDAGPAAKAPSCQVVKVGELWEHVPEETPRIDHGERLRQLEQRRLHVAKRYQR